MLKIAVCDDEPEELRGIVRMVDAYRAARPETAFAVEAFAGGRELLAAVRERGGFDLYVLDIVMPDPDGIETGRALRAGGAVGEIVYITTSRDHAIDSYDVRAFFYLVKPVEEQRLFDVIDEAAAKLDRRRAHSITVSTRDGARRILVDRILYAERVGRAIRYYCTDGIVDTQTIRASFRNAMAPLLADARFQLCGASFLVNLEHVAAVEHNAAVLDSGDEVPLPRTAASAFKIAWGRFWLNGSD